MEASACFVESTRTSKHAHARALATLHPRIHATRNIFTPRPAALPACLARGSSLSDVARHAASAASTCRPFAQRRFGPPQSAVLKTGTVILAMLCYGLRAFASAPVPLPSLTCLFLRLPQHKLIAPVHSSQGMHSSINIHISEAYYPPSKGKRAGWEPNLERFMRHFGANPGRCTAFAPELGEPRKHASLRVRLCA